MDAHSTIISARRHLAEVYVLQRRILLEETASLGDGVVFVLLAAVDSNSSFAFALLPVHL